MLSAIGSVLAEFSAVQLAAAFLVTAFATVVQFRLGVGFGLTAAPLLALISPTLVPVPVTVLTLVTATLAMAQTRHGIDWREVTVSVSGRLAGAWAGVSILLALDDRKQFMLVFGLMIAAAVLLSVAGLKFRFTRPLLFVMGTLSGVMATVTSVGGPPMAIAYQDQPPERARPNLSAYFALGCVVILVMLWLHGLLGWTEIVHSAVLFPALLIGMAAAPFMRGLIDRNFRKVLLVLSGSAALILIGRGLS